MDVAEVGARVTVAYDDLSDVWPYVNKALEARLPLRKVMLNNKLGAAAVVDELAVQYIAANDQSLQRLQQNAGSPVTWFRQPFASLVLISCDDADAYKLNFRLQLRAMVDPEVRSPLAAEPVFVYVRPPALDTQSKGPGRVLDAMRRELGSRRRERIVRIDPPHQPDGGASGAFAVEGLDDLIAALREAVRATLEARASAYDLETRRHLSFRGDPAWAFSDLFLIKDSLAVMMEACGLLDDALREYLELEVVHQQGLVGASGQQQSLSRGAPLPGTVLRGEDEAAAMWAGWAAARALVQAGGDGADLAVRQALFSCQARVLLKMRRHSEVLQRGLAMVTAANAALAVRQAAGEGPPLLREAWSCAACLSLAAVVSTLHSGARSPDALRSPRATKGARAAVAAASGSTKSFLVGLGLAPPSPAKEPWSSDESIDWQLGELPPSSAPPTGLPDPPAAGGADTAAASSRGGSAAMYRMLGQLYCMARQELEQLGAACGLQVPANPSTLATALKALPAAAPANGVSSFASTRTQSGLVQPGSPQRSRGRSLSPSRTSLDMSGMARAVFSASAGGDSDDDALSRSPGAGLAAVSGPGSQLGFADERMQTVDLSAAATVAAMGHSNAAAGPAVPDGAGATAAAAAAADLPSSGAAELELLPAASSIVPPLEQRKDGDAASAAAPAAAPPSAPSPHPPHPRTVSVSSSLTDAGAAPTDTSAGPPSHLSVRTDGAPSESESGPSTPGSSDTAGGQQGLTSPGPPPFLSPSVPPLPQPLMATTLRQVERIIAGSTAGTPRPGSRVSTGSDASTPSGSRPSSAQTRGSGAAWVPMHWRLRMALSSQAAFADLWTSLSQAAARCFAAAGRRRHALLLQVDVADALAAQGSLAQAAELYEAQCRAAVQEGWLEVVAPSLPKLAACQAALGGGGLPHTAAALVALLLQRRAAAADLAMAAQLMVRSASLPAAALPFPPLLVPTDATLVEGVADASSFLTASPIRGSYSRFYGHGNAEGRPVLLPPAGPAAGAAGLGGAAVAAVGDVLVVSVEVNNRLPVEVPLSEVVLTLVGLQEMAVAVTSPREVSPRRQPSLNMQLLQQLQQQQQQQHVQPSSARQSISVPPPLAAGGLHSGLHSAMPAGTPLSSAAAPNSATSAMGPGPGGAFNAVFTALQRLSSGTEEESPPRYLVQWKEVEELRCCLVGITPPGARAAGTAAPIVEGPLRPLSGPAVLLPGVNVLHFLAGPVKRGLHKTGHLSACLHQLQLHLPVRAAAGAWQLAPATPPPLPPSPDQDASSAPSTHGHMQPDAVMLVVEPAAPRLGVALAAAADGGLLAGHQQWLGLHVAPLRDRLQAASLAVAWPLPPAPAAELVRKASAGPPGVASSGSARKLTLGGMSSSSSDLAAVAPRNGADAGLPLLMPQHHAALVTTPAAGPAREAGAEREVLLVQCSGEEESLGGIISQQWGPTHDGSHELHVPPPSLTSAAGFTAWWWVGAGAVAAPPEQVRVSPPGSAVLSARGEQSLVSPHGGGGGAHALGDTIVQLPVTLEYVSGCRRTHCEQLAVAVRQPFVVQTSGQELPSGAVVLTFHLTSTLPALALLTACDLAPQPGLLLRQSVAAQVGLLPLALPPHATFSLTFVLELDHNVACGDRAAAQVKLQQAAKLQPSALSLAYEVAAERLCDSDMHVGGGPSYATVHEGGHGEATTVTTSARRGSVAMTDAVPARTVRSPGAASLRQLNAMDYSAGSGNADGSTGGWSAELPPQACAFVHRCSLELCAVQVDLPGALVLLQLLGPFSAVAGHPTSLCWRLERSGEAEPADRRAVRLQFEIAADGDLWRPVGRRGGCITLDAHDGALATVEVTCVPLVAGAVAVPTLHLQDVPYQELFDVGIGGTNYVQVAAP